MKISKFDVMLKSLRKENGLSQDDFAHIMNVTGATVSRWESGHVEPDYQTLINICEYFDVSTDYILGLED